MCNINSIEVVKVSQIKELVEQTGELFEQQYFTIAERQMSKISANSMQYFASRLAAKTAVLKILDLEENWHSLWHDIEIQRLSKGEPTVVLSARGQEIAAALGIDRWLLSISHTPCYAAASAIAISGFEAYSNFQLPEPQIYRLKRKAL